MKSYFSLLLVALFALAAFAPVAVHSEDRPLARGDGIVLTSRDVQKVVRYFSDKDLVIARDAVLSGTLRLRLFAREAVELGLDPDVQELDPTDVEQLFLLRSMYLRHVLEQQPVSNQAVESYYYAHPERFEFRGIRLNRETREHIAGIVRRANLQAVQDREFRDLKEKYNVVTCDSPGACE